MGPVAGADLGHGPYRMCLHGERGHGQLGRDLVVAEAARDEDDHVPLPGCQGVEASEQFLVDHRGRAVGHVADERGRRGGRQRTATADDLGDSGDEFGGAHGLAQETVGARAQGGEDDVVLVESGQHDHPYLFGRVLLADPAGGFDAVDAGHPDVHQDQVDGVVPEEGDGLECVGEIARDDKTRVEPEHCLDAGPDLFLVVDDQDSRHRTTAPRGLNSAWTRNRPSSLSIVSRPLEDSTRSRMPRRPSPLPEPRVV